jgi:hypothetical protein
MVEMYFIDKWQHDALIRAAEYGKDCHALEEVDRIMCECAEDALKDVTKVFSSRPYNDNRPAIVKFHVSELQIPALERAWGLLRLEHSMDTGWNLIVDGKFPDFEKAVPSVLTGVKCFKPSMMEAQK